MLRASDQVVVLHARPYRETSLMLDLFAREYGRLTAVVKGVRREGRRSNRADLQSFRLLEGELSGRGEVLNFVFADCLRIFPLAPGRDQQSGFYVNELLLRLLPKGDPHASLFQRYLDLLGQITTAHGNGELAHALRLFENELLDELGYGLRFDVCAESGEAIDPEQTYQIDAELGVVPNRMGSERPRVLGRTLIALTEGAPLDAAGLRELKTVMRAVLLFRLGGRPLRAWAGFQAV